RATPLPRPRRWRIAGLVLSVGLISGGPADAFPWRPDGRTAARGWSMERYFAVQGRAAEMLGAWERKDRAAVAKLADEVVAALEGTGPGPGGEPGTETRKSKPPVEGHRKDQA